MSLILSDDPRPLYDLIGQLISHPFQYFKTQGIPGCTRLLSTSRTFIYTSTGLSSKLSCIYNVFTEDIRTGVTIISPR